MVGNTVAMVSPMASDLTARLAATVRAARTERNMSVSAFAQFAGVSRAMISKIERAEVQPTAVLLARLSSALGLTLSELISRAEQDRPRVSRAGAQPEWTDPVSGYRRRAVSPSAGGPVELVEVSLPPGARVDMEEGTYALVSQQIWVLDGHLRFHEGDLVHELDRGDCLQLGAPAPCAFVNPAETECRYLVVVAKLRT